MKWLLISEKSLAAIKQWAESTGVLDSLIALNIQVADYDGQPIRMDDGTTVKLPCNCLARKRVDASTIGFHSSECASVYDDTPEGIAAYEDWTGQSYGKEASP